MYLKHLIFWKTSDKKLKKKTKCCNRNLPPDDFVAPDGGWGWLVAIASGMNLLLCFALAHHFGIVYRDQMVSLGLTGPQLTTIINMEIAMSSFVGLINGPLNRHFTFRQIALMGSILSFLGTFLTIFANSFIFYLCSFSVFYGLARGVIYTSSCLAVNTYFQKRRRTATALQCGVFGLGPILLPYILTFLMEFYGMKGTVLIFSGISLHLFASALIFQPVKWHAKKSKEVKSEDVPKQTEIQLQDQKIVISSEPNEPKRQSSASQRCKCVKETIVTGVVVENKEAYKQTETHPKEIERETQTVIQTQSKHVKPLRCKLKNEQERTNQSDKNQQKTKFRHAQEESMTHSCFQKFVTFFDLDLLKDFTYINLAFGLTITYFVDFNFTVLTPFILAEFGLTNSQIASTLTTWGLSDTVVRFLVPFIIAKMNFSNKTYLLAGVLGLCIGRTMLCVTRGYYTIMGVFLWQGVCKGARIVFWALILPDYVPLSRLPAATGLQVMMEFFFSMSVGPVLGVIHDNFDYVAVLIFLNVLQVSMISSWILEDLWRKCQRRPTALSVLSS